MLERKPERYQVQYKTIVMALLERFPEARDRLRGMGTALELLDSLAAELRESHLDWKARLRERWPGSAEFQIASEAMELAVRELSDRLSCATDSDADGPLSLDGAMAYLRHHTPPA